MSRVSKFLAALALWALPSLALAQAPQLDPGQIFANDTAATRQARAANITAVWDRAFGTTNANGTVFARSGGSWGKTATPTLGISGTVIGSISFANLTSGSVTLQPATGALGSATATFPAGTYNVVGDTLTQTLTNKTLTSPAFTFGTGSTQNITATSANTAFANQLIASNTGTSSNAATIATVSATLGVANSSVSINANGGATLTGSLAAGSGLTGGLTISTGAGPITLSSSAVHTATTGPTQAAGNTVVAGTLAAPSLSGNGQSYVYNTVAGGAVLQGVGSTNDFVLANKAGSTVCQNPTGTTNLSCAGQILSGAQTITATSATALAVGQNGTINPALVINTSVASSANGWAIQSQAAGANALLAVSSSATNENGRIDAKGSGTLALNATATGAVTIGAGGLQINGAAAITAIGTGVPAALGVNTGSAGAFSVLVASGTSALGTSAIGSAACATVVTTAATNTLTTDAIIASFNGDPTAVTGYIPSTAGMLTIFSYPTANNVNFKVCNNSGSSITPGAITLNWRVVR